MIFGDLTSWYLVILSETQKNEDTCLGICSSVNLSLKAVLIELSKFLLMVFRDKIWTIPYCSARIHCKRLKNLD